MLRIFTVLFLLSSTICLGQKIDGKYVLQTKSDRGARALYFLNGTFSDTFTGHLNSTVIGKGTYKIEQGKISLRYLRQAVKDTSTYIIEQQDSGTDKGNVSVRIFDESNFSSPGWIDLINDKEQVQAKLINNGKEATNFLISDKQITSIRMTYLGYSSVRISTKRLMRKNSTITVKMHPVTEILIDPGIVSYQIRKITSDSIRLYTAKEGELFFIKESL